MLAIYAIFFSCTSGLFGVLAAPAPSITMLSAEEIASYRPYTHYASAAYCRVGMNWDCGKNCRANPNFEPVAVGGNGGSVQYWYVGIDRTLGTVIVAHQGTNPSKPEAVLTDLKLLQTTPDPVLFPGIPAAAKVHRGFATAHANTAEVVYAAVRSALVKSNMKKLASVGHSLGGALAILHALSLGLRLPGISIAAYTYGQPRVGNDAFAQFINHRIWLQIHRIINRMDLVPNMPSQSFWYKHCKGGKRIGSDSAWYVCDGDEGDQPGLITGSLADHSGPYDGVYMGDC